MSSTTHPVFRPAGISYLHIPSADPNQSARFYERVFGWSIREGAEDARFEDGTGHVIGAFVKDRHVVRGAGVLLYVYVDDLDAALRRARDAGAQIVEAVYPEGNLRVATFCDPLGLEMGVWEQAKIR
jgi:predicted enzyme related to lactoylglutathione lyase